jgi:hypothetical protein
MTWPVAMLGKMRSLKTCRISGSRDAGRRVTIGSPSGVQEDMMLKQIVACAFVAMAAGCGEDHGMYYATAPTQATVVGSGRMVSESRPVQGFHTVVVTGGVHALVTDGSDDSLEITAEDNILPLVASTVSDGRLTVGWRPGSGSVSSHGVVCRIGARTLRGVTAAGAGRIDVEGIDANDFAIDLSGASSFAGSGSVERLRLDLSGASRADAPGLAARFVTATLSGASVARLRVVDALVVNASGASLLEFYGDPTVQADTSGASLVRRIGQ